MPKLKRDCSRDADRHPLYRHPDVEIRRRFDCETVRLAAVLSIHRRTSTNTWVKHSNDRSVGRNFRDAVGTLRAPLIRLAARDPEKTHPAKHSRV